MAVSDLIKKYSGTPAEKAASAPAPAPTSNTNVGKLLSKYTKTPEQIAGIQEGKARIQSSIRPLQGVTQAKQRQEERKQEGVERIKDSIMPVTALAGEQTYTKPSLVRKLFSIPKSFSEGFVGKEEGPVSRLPYVGDIVDMATLSRVLTVTNKMKNKEPVTQEDQAFIQDYYDKQRAVAKRSEDDMAFYVGSIAGSSVTFMMELFGATLLAPETGGGSWAALFGGKTALKGTKELVEKAIKDKVFRSLLQREIGKVGINFGVQVGVTGTTNVPAGTLERMVGSPIVDETGKVVHIADDGQQVGEAIVNSITSHIVEVGSERTGAVFGLLGDAVKMPLVKAGILKALLQKNPDIPPSVIQKIVRKAGWNGVLQEFGEERIADVAYGVLYEAGLSDTPFELPSGRDIAAELISFAFMGSAVTALDKTVQYVKQGTKPNAPDTDVEQEVEQMVTEAQSRIESGESPSVVAMGMSQEMPVDVARQVVQEAVTRVATTDNAQDKTEEAAPAKKPEAKPANRPTDEKTAGEIDEEFASVLDTHDQEAATLRTRLAEAQERVKAAEPRTDEKKQAKLDLEAIRGELRTLETEQGNRIEESTKAIRKDLETLVEGMNTGLPASDVVDAALERSAEVTDVPLRQLLDEVVQEMQSQKQEVDIALTAKKAFSSTSPEDGPTSIQKAEADIEEAKRLREMAPEQSDDQDEKTKVWFDNYIRDTEQWIAEKNKKPRPQKKNAPASTKNNDEVEDLKLAISGNKTAKGKINVKEVKLTEAKKLGFDYVDEEFARYVDLWSYQETPFAIVKWNEDGELSVLELLPEYRGKGISDTMIIDMMKPMFGEPSGLKVFMPNEDFLTMARRVADVDYNEGEGIAVLTPKNALPGSAEEAANRYWDEVLQSAVDKGEAVVIGADNLKDYFGNDYDTARHKLYSEATNMLYERALKEVSDPLVKFTVGGTGSGKSDFVVGFNKVGFAGIIYDSTGWNYEGMRGQIDRAIEAGKKVEVYGIVPDIRRARAYTFLRELRGEHPVTETAFVRTHSGAINTMIKLIDDGVEVYALDTRNVFSEEQAASTKFVYSPRVLLEEVWYSESNVKELIKDVTKENAEDIIAQGQAAQRSREAGADNVPTKSRTNKKLSQRAERIAAHEAELRTAYEATGPSTVPGFTKADEVLAGIATELELSEAGKRIIIDDHDATRDSGVIGVPSTFPKWIPEGLRSSKLFSTVFGSLEVSKLSYPTGNRTRQRALYDTLLNELDAQLGIDTSAIRNRIIQAYETKNDDQSETEEVDRGGTPGGEEFDAEAEAAKIWGDEVEPPKTEEKQKPVAQTSTAALGTLEGQMALMRRLQSGEASLEEYKAGFEAALAAEATIKAGLSKQSKQELLKRLDPFHAAQYKRESKNRLVDAVYERTVMRYSLGDSLTIPISGGGTYLDAVARAVRAKVEKQTEDGLRAYADAVKEQTAAMSERNETIKKALDDPQTADDFRIFIQVKGKNALTPAQLARYDAVVAEIAKAKAEKAREEKGAVAGVQAGTDATVQETTHTRTGEPLFVVKLGDRVERDTYKELLARAKQLGGWYSSYRGGGAIPGFQFKKREDADAFVLVVKGENVQTDRFEERAEEKKGTAAEKLRSVAENLETKGREKLNQDRKSNTSRRARMAASAEADAERDIAMAKTLRNIADAIERGGTTMLENVTSRTHVELLDTLMRQTRYAEARANDAKNDSEGNRVLFDVSDRTYTYVPSFPPTIYNAREVIQAGLKTRGYMRIAKAAQKVMTPDGEYKPRGVIAMDEFAQMAKATGELDKQYSNLASQVADYKRLRAMGVTNDSTLRVLLREYTEARVEQQGVDPIKKLERALVGRKVGIDFFPTPKSVAAQMVAEADIEPGMTVLEPSAGSGNIAEVIRDETGVTPTVIEISGDLRELLEAKGFEAVDHDFLSHADKYDRIVMNPPFSDHADVRHVRHAYELLNPGGKLVAIMGEGAFFRSQKEDVEFREWLDELGGTSEQLPAGTFTDVALLATTGVNARVVVIEKEGSQARFKQKLTTKTLDRLAGRASVSKQFILDLTNQPDLKQTERDLIRKMLEDEGDKVDVPAFFEKVQAELLPLEVQSSDLYKASDGKSYDYSNSMVEEGAFTPKYETVSLQGNIRGDVENYKETIYESPIATSAGNVHFEYQTKNYFAHSRTEDMADGQTRRVIEVQSDLFQKGRLESSLVRDDVSAALRKPFLEKRVNDIARLEPYRNTWHERIIREEVAQAAKDGKGVLQFPTGETAMKIEGLGETNSWMNVDRRDGGAAAGTGHDLQAGDLVVGKEITTEDLDDLESQDVWIITDVLGEGKFKAVNERQLAPHEITQLQEQRRTERDISTLVESFDISGRIDTNNPIYKFYEKEVGRYLKNKYNAQRVTDDKGVSWWQLDVPTVAATEPVAAFRTQGSESQNLIGHEMAREYLTDLKQRLNLSFDVYFFDTILAGYKMNPFTKQKTGIEAWGATLDNTVALLKEMEQYTPHHEVGHLVLGNLAKIPTFSKRGITRSKLMRAQAEKMGIEWSKTTDAQIEEAMMRDFELYLQHKHTPKGILRTFFIWLKEQMVRVARAMSITKGDIIKDYYDILDEGRAVDDAIVRLENRGVIEAFQDESTLDVDVAEDAMLARTKVKEGGADTIVQGVRAGDYVRVTDNKTGEVIVGYVREVRPQGKTEYGQDVSDRMLLDRTERQLFGGATMFEGKTVEKYVPTEKEFEQIKATRRARLEAEAHMMMRDVVDDPLPSPFTRFKIKRDGDARYQKLQKQYNELAEKQQQREKELAAWRKELAETVRVKKEAEEVKQAAPDVIKALARNVTRTTPPVGEITEAGKAKIAEAEDPQKTEEQVREYLLRKEQVKQSRAALQTLRRNVAEAKKGGKTDAQTIRDLERRIKMRKRTLARAEYYLDRGFKQGYKKGSTERYKQILADNRQKIESKGRREKLVKIFKLVKRATRTGNLLPLEYQERLTDIFATLDLKKMTAKTKKSLQRTQEFFAAQEGDVPKDIAAKLARLDKVPVGAMSDDQVQEILDEVLRVFENGVTKKRLMDSRDEKLFAEKLERIVNSTKNQGDAARKRADKALLLKMYDPTRFADMMDGGQNYSGANFKELVEPIRNAIDRATLTADDLLAEAFEQIGMFADVFTDEQMAHIMYHSALRQGAEEQANALAQHYKTKEGWDFTMPLTKEEEGALNIMEGVFKEIRPGVAGTYEQLKNMPFPDNPHYFPFRYDSDVELYQIEDNAFDFTVTKTPQGFTMKREPGVSRVLDINVFQTFARQVSSQVYYAEVQPALENTRAFINASPYMAKMNRQTRDYWKQFVEDVATRGNSGQHFLGKGWLDKTRGNISAAILGYKLSTILIQPSAIFDAMIGIRQELGPRAVAEVLPRFMKMVFSPAALRAATDVSMALEARQGGMVEISEMRNVAKGVFADSWWRRSWSTFKTHAYTGIRVVDMRTAAAVFDTLVAGYKRKGLSDTAAVARAEQIMMLSQGSSNVAARPQILNSSVTKFFLPFQTFIINAFNNLRYDAVVREIQNNGNVKGTLLAISNMQFLGYALLYETLMYQAFSAFFGYGDDDKPLWKRILAQGVGRIPGSGYLFAWDGSFEGLRLNNPAIEEIDKALTSAWKIGHGDTAPKQWYTMLRAVLTLRGVPGTQQTHQVVTSPNYGIDALKYDDRKNSEKRTDTLKDMDLSGPITEAAVENVAKDVYGKDYEEGDATYRANKREEVLYDMAMRKEYGYDDPVVNATLAKTSNNEVKAAFLATDSASVSRYRKTVRVLDQKVSLFSDQLYNELLAIERARPEEKAVIAKLVVAKDDGERDAALQGDKNLAKRMFQRYKVIQKEYYETVGQR